MTISLRQSIAGSSLLRLMKDIERTAQHHLAEDVEFRYHVASLNPPGKPKGNILISRNHKGFFLKPGEQLPTTHQSYWESRQLAKICLSLGYTVDVVHYLNDSFIPAKDYSLFIDVKWNMDRIGPLLNRDCVKVLHAIYAHPLSHNAAELKRILALQQRRGVTLQPRRQERMDWAIEHADCATVLGNEFTLSTFRYANKPLYRVPLASPTTYPWPEAKEFDRVRSRFLFFAGDGMVHKGLDLVLEAFAAMPRYSLIVCGPVEAEEDFVRAYRRELYETENIHLAGWVDVSSENFTELADSCVALIHPSCSESGCVSAITCMHAALIPVVSYESSVDVTPDFGILLKKSAVEEIQDVVRSIATCPAASLRGMARNAWEHARKHHTRERFFEEYSKVLSKLLSEKNGGQGAGEWRAVSPAVSGHGYVL